MSETEGPPPVPESGPPAAESPDKNARTMGMLCHLLAICGVVIPLGNIVGPLVIWLLKKDEHPFIDDQGKESLNFQITVTIALAVSGLLICVTIGFVLMPIVGIAALVFVIIAAIKANDGEAYRYPLTIRLLK